MLPSKTWINICSEIGINLKNFRYVISAHLFMSYILNLNSKEKIGTKVLNINVFPKWIKTNHSVSWTGTATAATATSLYALDLFLAFRSDFETIWHSFLNSPFSLSLIWLCIHYLSDRSYDLKLSFLKISFVLLLTCYHSRDC